MNERRREETQERIGVYVCHCGSNIAGVVNVAEVHANGPARTCPTQGVVVARDYKFMCSSLGQELIAEGHQGAEADRVVVAACSPHLHETDLPQRLQSAPG